MEAIGRIVPFVYINNLLVRVKFGAVDSLRVPFVVRKLFIDRVVKAILPMQSCVVQTWTCPIPIISEYTTLSNHVPML